LLFKVCDIVGAISSDRQTAKGKCVPYWKWIRTVQTAAKESFVHTQLQTFVLLILIINVNLKTTTYFSLVFKYAVRTAQ